MINIKNLLIEHNLSVTQAAKDLKISRVYMSNLVNNRVLLSMRMAVKISDYFGIPLSSIIELPPSVPQISINSDNFTCSIENCKHKAGFVLKAENTFTIFLCRDHLKELAKDINRYLRTH